MIFDGCFCVRWPPTHIRNFHFYYIWNHSTVTTILLPYCTTSQCNFNIVEQSSYKDLAQCSKSDPPPKEGCELMIRIANGNRDASGVRVACCLSNGIRYTPCKIDRQPNPLKLLEERPTFRTHLHCDSLLRVSAHIRAISIYAQDMICLLNPSFTT